MENPSFVPDYAKAAHPGRRIPPPPVIIRLWRLCLIMAIAMSFLCFVIELENLHFDSFFPRRAERPGSHWLKSFEPDVVVDEMSWRDWQCMLTEKEDWYTKPLSAADRGNLAIRIAENGRWNRFVILVKWGSPLLLTLSIAVCVLSILLLRWLDWRTAIGRWRVTQLMLVVSMILTFDVLGRDYLRLLGDSIW